MTFKLEALPYSYDALEPFISPETIEYHYDKHHAGYVTKLNQAVTNQAPNLAQLELSAVINETKNATRSPYNQIYKGVYNNASQIWNHTFYWNSITPKPQKLNHPKILAAINNCCGSLEEFKTNFKTIAGDLFGSGWTFLVYNHEQDKLNICNYQNADNPLGDSNLTPLMTCDVWEHAYYIDYRNSRPQYLTKFVEHINWEFVIQNFENI